MQRFYLAFTLKATTNELLRDGKTWFFLESQITITHTLHGIHSFKPVSTNTGKMQYFDNTFDKSNLHRTCTRLCQ